MPFSKLFHKRSAKKSSSFNGIDLSERKCEEPPDCGHKSSHKNILHYFSNSKTNSHVHFKASISDKEKKSKNRDSVSQSLKSNSLTQLPSNGKDNSSNSSEGGSNSIPSSGPRRASSYGTFMDSLSRERRLMEIAQLDSYMNYLRHTEDEGNMASRLCCAQVLKMSLMRLEQRHLQSQERIDLCHKGSASSRLSLSNHSTQKLQVSNTTEDARSCRSASSDAHAPFSSDSDNRGSERDSGSDPDSEDNCGVDNNLVKLKLDVKNSRTPVWPRDIEIF